MIYIHYKPIHQILNLQLDRVTHEMRQQLRAYRNQVLEAKSANLILGKTDQGKPIALNSPEFVFNHSHSQAHYALAYSHDVQDLGIDIEDLNRKVRMQALAKRSFHPTEFLMWQSLDYCPHYWFKVWTIKEAVLKAHGMGIRLDLHSLNTQAHPTWDFGCVEHPLLGQFMYQCFTFPQSMLTVAYRKNHMDLQQLCFI